MADAVTDRIAALEGESETLKDAIASLEVGIRAHKPIRLGEAQHRALRAVVAAARREPAREPFVRPATLQHGLAPTETRPKHDHQETRTA